MDSVDDGHAWWSLGDDEEYMVVAMVAMAIVMMGVGHAECIRVVGV